MDAEDSIEEWYQSGYDVCYHQGLLGRVWDSVYRVMELPYRGSRGVKDVLEVGAGNGPYRSYVKHPYERYFEIDLRNQNTSSPIDRLVQVQGNVEDLSQFADASFDRLISTCVLVHLRNPEAALREWRRVVKPGGYLTIYVPPEPGLLVRVIRRLFIWPKAAKLLDANPRTVAILEHRYHYPFLRHIIETQFSQDRTRRKRYPTRFLGWNLTLFEVFHIKKSQVESSSGPKSV